MPGAPRAPLTLIGRALAAPWGPPPRPTPRSRRSVTAQCRLRAAGGRCARRKGWCRSGGGRPAPGPARLLCLQGLMNVQSFRNASGRASPACSLPPLPPPAVGQCPLALPRPAQAPGAAAAAVARRGAGACRLRADRPHRPHAREHERAGQRLPPGRPLQEAAHRLQP